jgi:hypothetical protein
MINSNKKTIKENNMPIFVTYFEMTFEVAYLILVIILGIILIRTAKDQEHKLFGFMALILGGGDSFHLVPRIISKATNTFAQHSVSLGIGEMITSITMTIFYVFLYQIYKMRYKRFDTKKLDWTVFFLAALRIIIVVLPQNGWTMTPKPYNWGIIRNIPFTILGIILIVLFMKETKDSKIDIYHNMPIAITLSFLFYFVVVLCASIIPALGMFMLPKTLAYVWIVYMGLKDNRITLK